MLNLYSIDFLPIVIRSIFNFFAYSGLLFQLEKSVLLSLQFFPAHFLDLYSGNRLFLIAPGTPLLKSYLCVQHSLTGT